MHDIQRNISKNIAVIGAGLGGLASACTLAARGHRVTVFEANDWLGGKAAVLESNGFRFDMGPTILTLPSVLRKIYQEAGLKMEEHLPMLKLDPQWRCFFQDNTQLDLVENVEAMAQKITSFTHNSNEGKGFEQFMRFSADLNDLSQRFFFWKSVEGIGDMFTRDKWSPLEGLDYLRRLNMGRTVSESFAKHVTDSRVVQMLDHFIQYVGSAPMQSPAVLCGIAHMQAEEGIWYPIGGTGAVPKALRKLAIELGVTFNHGQRVAQITTKNGYANGVKLVSGQTLSFDAVVSNADAVRTYKELLSEAPASERKMSRKYEAACSGVVLYLGLNQRYDHLLHHNFIFSRDAHEEFESIYKKGEPAPDPTCYVCAPSCSEKDVAPEGGEALYVLVHTPYLRPRHDWKKMLPEYRQVILNKLATTGGMPDIKERIVFEHALTPQDIHERYSVLNGAIYGVASHGRFNGAFKSGNRSKTVKGLYLAGGAAHPGPGMPMVLMSGWIAADACHQDAVLCTK